MSLRTMHSIILIFSLRECSYCAKTKALLHTKSMSYHNIDVQSHPTVYGKMVEATGILTVPVVILVRQQNGSDGGGRTDAAAQSTPIPTVAVQLVGGFTELSSHTFSTVDQLWDEAANTATTSEAKNNGLLQGTLDWHEVLLSTTTSTSSVVDADKNEHSSDQHDSLLIEPYSSKAIQLPLYWTPLHASNPKATDERQQATPSSSAIYVSLQELTSSIRAAVEIADRSTMLGFCERRKKCFTALSLLEAIRKGRIVVAVNKDEKSLLVPAAVAAHVFLQLLQRGVFYHVREPDSSTSTTGLFSCYEQTLAAETLIGEDGGATGNRQLAGVIDFLNKWVTVVDSSVDKQDPTLKHLTSTGDASVLGSFWLRLREDHPPNPVTVLNYYRPPLYQLTAPWNEDDQRLQLPSSTCVDQRSGDKTVSTSLDQKWWQHTSGAARAEAVLQLVAALRRQMGALVSEVTDLATGMVDFELLALSTDDSSRNTLLAPALLPTQEAQRSVQKGFAAVQDALCELQAMKIVATRCDTPGRDSSSSPLVVPMTPSQLNAFAINLYNLCILQAYAVRGAPDADSTWQRYHFFHQTGYNIGGYVYDLVALENGVLRGNREYFNGWGKAPFGRKEDDPRTSCGFMVPRPSPPETEHPNGFDCRLHFALNCGAKSCPPIKVFEYASPEAFDKALMLAANSFIASTTTISLVESLIPKKKATNDQAHPLAAPIQLEVSQIITWYAEDFYQPLMEREATTVPTQATRAAAGSGNTSNNNDNLQRGHQVDDVDQEEDDAALTIHHYQRAYTKDEQTAMTILLHMPLVQLMKRIEAVHAEMAKTSDKARVLPFSNQQQKDAKRFKRVFQDAVEATKNNDTSLSLEVREHRLRCFAAELNRYVDLATPQRKKKLLRYAEYDWSHVCMPRKPH